VRKAKLVESAVRWWRERHLGHREEQGRRLGDELLACAELDLLPQDSACARLGGLGEPGCCGGTQTNQVNGQWSILPAAPVETVPEESTHGSAVEAIRSPRASIFIERNFD
jgi:hypothetical protein